MKAQCIRCGKCCQRLIKSMNFSKNTTGIPKGWVKARDESKHPRIFRCPHLQRENVCLLQDDKPEICSHSLSEERLACGTRASNFFSVKCGWLIGCPEEIYALVLDNQRMIDFNKHYYPIRIVRKYEKEHNKHSYKIVNGLWIKELKKIHPLIEKPSSDDLECVDSSEDWANRKLIEGEI